MILRSSLPPRKMSLYVLLSLLAFTTRTATGPGRTATRRLPFPIMPWSIEEYPSPLASTRYAAWTLTEIRIRPWVDWASTRTGPPASSSAIITHRPFIGARRAGAIVATRRATSCRQPGLHTASKPAVPGEYVMVRVRLQEWTVMGSVPKVPLIVLFLTRGAERPGVNPSATVAVQ